LILPCDVEDIASVDATFETIKEEWGRLDFVVHAIGFSDKNELKGLLRRHHARPISRAPW
jgi:enoyl-[acyl-carrier protein] reductase I